MKGLRGWAAIFTATTAISFGEIPTTQAQVFSESYSFLRTCQQVRSYRAQSQSVYNRRELATLEYEYCAIEDPYYTSRRRRLNPVFVEIPPASASQDCIDATIMARLAIATEPYSPDTSEIAGFQKVLCSLPELEENNRTLEWRNGRNAKFGSSWYYPNGRQAKFGSNWYYPNGQNATFGSSWYYPNGKNAKFGSSWYFPDGDRTNLTSLLSWSCGILSHFDCEDRLGDLRSASGFWYDLTVVELSSRAYEEIYNYRRYDTYSDRSDDLDIDIDIIIK